MLLFLISVLPLRSLAQGSGEISGRITDHHDTPLSDLTIILNNGLRQTVSDEEGYFTFTGLADGHYTVRVLYFNSPAEKAITITGQEKLRLDFSIQAGSQELDAVTVSVNRKTIPSSTLRLSENLLVTPQNIQIIDQNMINDQVILSTAEGFTKNVSGARTVYHQEEGSAGIYVRGYSASNLRNGMDVSGSFGPLREDMAFVERIEFVKGPAGFMMGNTQPGGFYNIVTKKPKIDGESSARLTLGSFGLYRGEVDVNSKLSEDGKLLGRLNLMGTKKGSHVITVSHEQFVINPSVKYLLSDKTDFTAEYIYSQNAFTGGFSKYAYGLNNFKEVPDWFSFNDPIIQPTVVREHNIFGTINHLLSDTWMLTGQFGYINSGMQGESLYTFFNSIDAEGNVFRRLAANDALNTSTVGQVFAKGKFNIGQTQNNVLMGLDMGTKFYVADWTNLPDTVGGAFNIYDPVYGNLSASDIPVYDRSKPLRERGAMYLTEYTYYSAHFQDEVHLLNDRLRIGAGLRYTTTTRTSAASNGNRVDNSALTPRFSITGLLTPTLTAYALYDQSFQEQTGMQLNGDPVDPSRGINQEVGLKKAWFGGNLLAGITAYHLTRTNITTTAGPDNPGFVEQSGEATSKGIEVDINGRIGNSWNIMLNYAYTDAKITEDNDPSRVGQMLLGTAKHISNAWIKYTLDEGLLKGLGFMAGYEFQNKRAAWPVTEEKYLPDNLFLLDLGTTFKKDNYQISLLVNNLTNRYNYTGHFPGAWGYSHYGWRSLPPRSFRLTLGYSF
ncbi:TonB-dependent receptor [Olivibacter sp. SDN3]|nr:TonB-dependent receptor [Olivibacter sp. SDN3]